MNALRGEARWGRLAQPGRLWRGLGASFVVRVEEGEEVQDVDGVVAVEIGQAVRRCVRFCVGQACIYRVCWFGLSVRC